MAGKTQPRNQRRTVTLPASAPVDATNPETNEEVVMTEQQNQAPAEDQATESVEDVTTQDTPAESAAPTDKPDAAPAKQASSKPRAPVVMPEPLKAELTLLEQVAEKYRVKDNIPDEVIGLQKDLTTYCTELQQAEDIEPRYRLLKRIFSVATGQQNPTTSAMCLDLTAAHFAKYRDGVFGSTMIGRTPASATRNAHIRRENAALTRFFTVAATADKRSSISLNIDMASLCTYLQTDVQRRNVLAYVAS